jgi:GT2 family glycosyltransferase
MTELTSIVILGWNQAEYTKLCVESVQRYTSEPYELILVDNGSKDDSAAFMQSVAGAKVIINGENRGFAGGNNQGIRAAAGRWIVLLNNDTIVTKGWLSRLISHAEKDPKVGMVSPMSNYVATADQRVSPDYTLETLQKFAALYARKHPGQQSRHEFLSGFCWLVKREVFAQVGVLDEEFAIGGFEDNDFCMRAHRAGWALVVARDTFIHHFGSKSFEGNNLDRSHIQNENGRRFAEKWGVAVRSADGSRYILPALLQEATDAMAGGRPRQALAALERHLQKFPHDAACRESAERIGASLPKEEAVI